MGDAAGIDRWLDDLGLGAYKSVFARNDITLEALPTLTGDDLKELIPSIGHRRTLAAAIAKQGPIVPQDRRPDAERRQLTVMFCDLVGSTALSERLDPEDLKEVITSYQDACAGAIARYEGVVARLLGDGVLAYFGFPQAHEDDAERAVRAALEVIEKVKEVASHDGEPLLVRVGIATGGVVVGDVVGKRVSDKDAVVGETPNLAARLQGVAEPNGIVISSSTKRLVDGIFVLADLGTSDLKGFAEPVRAWRVVSEIPAETRFDASYAAQLMGFVGREQEVSLLIDRWRQAGQGEGQVVLLSGEAGIGKSRILQKLRERIGGENHVRLRYQCSPYHENSALYPIVRQLEGACHFDPDEENEGKVGKLRRLLAESSDAVDEVLPYFCSVMSLEMGGSVSRPDLSSQEMKERILTVLADQVVSVAQRTPTLLIVEDAHWMDPTTLELVGRTVARVSQLRLMVVVTYRPTFNPPWGQYPNVTMLTVPRLSRTQCSEVILQTAGKFLPPDLLGEILGRADGVPLFLEELTKEVLEAGLLKDAGDRYVLIGPLAPLTIPATIQDSLTARLDRLAPEKEVAQIAATIGREFSYDLLAAASSLESSKLENALDRLAKAEMIFAHGTPPQSKYTFRHALVRDAAYSTLLRGKRQQIHGKIAQALLARSGGSNAARPELLAHHLTEAGLVAEAIVHWQQAGDQALQNSANLEAIAHYRRGVQLQSHAAPSAEGTQRELNIQIALAQALIAAKGYAADETAQAFERAAVILDAVGVAAEKFPVLYGLCVRHIVGAKFDTALELARQLASSVQHSAEEWMLCIGHRVLGTVLLLRGELAEAKEHLEQAIAYYDPHTHGQLKFRFNQDIGVAALCFQSWLMFLQGSPAAGIDPLSHARRSEHAHTLAYALYYQGIVLEMFKGNSVVVRQNTLEMAEISRQHGLGVWSIGAQIVDAWLEGQDGRHAEAIERLRAGLLAYRNTASEIFRPLFLALYSETLAAAGRMDDALRALDEAQTLTDSTGERWFEPELWRSRGELLLKVAPANLEDVERCFQVALSLAGERGARAWEIRAALSLARLWGSQNRHQPARELIESRCEMSGDGKEAVEARDLLRRFA